MSVGRIRERESFERLTRDGVRAGGDALWCRYLADPAVVPPRAAFAISRSVGSAVRRNRLRRRLRAAVRSVAGTPTLIHGWVLVGARPPALERTFDELRTELTVMLGGLTSGADA